MADSNSTRTKVVAARDAMSLLYVKAEDRLTLDELEAISCLTERAWLETLRLAGVLEGIACLVANDSDAGSFQSKQDVFELLVSTSQSLDAIAGMAEIGGYAEIRIRKLEAEAAEQASASNAASTTSSEPQAA